LANAIITLTTDYGTNDHLVGTLKGVILKINPDVTIVDITHNITAFDLLDGALAIGSAYSYFPPKTIHVVVVDPGVGTERGPLLVSAQHQYFVAPDNGVLSVIYEREKESLVVRHANLPDGRRDIDIGISGCVGFSLLSVARIGGNVRDEPFGGPENAGMVFIGFGVCSLVGLVDLCIPHGIAGSMLGSLFHLDVLQAVLYTAIFALPAIMAVSALTKPPMQGWQAGVALAGFVMGVVKFRVWNLVLHLGSAPPHRIVLVGAIVVGAIAAIGLMVKPETTSAESTGPF